MSALVPLQHITSSVFVAEKTNFHFATTPLQAASEGMLTSGGRRGAKRFLELPLKVNAGLRLHLWHCEDLRLISFRCWLASLFTLWTASAHAYALIPPTPAALTSFFRCHCLLKLRLALRQLKKTELPLCPAPLKTTLPACDTETNGKANTQLISKKK